MAFGQDSFSIKTSIMIQHITNMCVCVWMCRYWHSGGACGCHQMCSPRTVNYPEDERQQAPPKWYLWTNLRESYPRRQNSTFQYLLPIRAYFWNWSTDLVAKQISGNLLYLHLCESSKFHVNLIILRYSFSLKNHPQCLLSFAGIRKTFGWFWKERTVLKLAA